MTTTDGARPFGVPIGERNSSRAVPAKLLFDTRL
jgi:hypothetical protein